MYVSSEFFLTDRRSTRIQDLEQREEAERIRQQNLEEEQKALEEMAEKGLKHVRNILWFLVVLLL